MFVFIDLMLVQALQVTATLPYAGGWVRVVIAALWALNSEVIEALSEFSRHRRGGYQAAEAIALQSRRARRAAAP
ncbi:hypothetical protein QA640_28710 [Bradyrhizobium sp. CB82]|uniref:hypothetical protein n=1 Tax=Bradyrhizobium sp. CB82 TaxID=3039159 RepID=UPI0024B110E6|nr:hypothetical protein [Bradyrhizobium sp. CB82]WFU38393.1 hypothetical protein QA640_28710 [Bradyrhizobium sp. CB82]